LLCEFGWELELNNYTAVDGIEKIDWELTKRNCNELMQELIEWN